jgi:hypothetical protein
VVRIPGPSTPDNSSLESPSVLVLHYCRIDHDDAVVVHEALYAEGSATSEKQPRPSEARSTSSLSTHSSPIYGSDPQGSRESEFQ